MHDGKRCALVSASCFLKARIAMIDRHPYLNLRRLCPNALFFLVKGRDLGFALPD